MVMRIGMQDRGLRAARATSTAQARSRCAVQTLKAGLPGLFWSAGPFTAAMRALSINSVLFGVCVCVAVCVCAWLGVRGCACVLVCVRERGHSPMHRVRSAVAAIAPTPGILGRITVAAARANACVLPVRGICA